MGVNTNLSEIEIFEDTGRVSPYTILTDALIRDDVNYPIDPAVSFGWYSQNGQSKPYIWGSYGDISTVVGKEKTMKTQTKNIFLAAYLKGNLSTRFSGLMAHKTDGKYILELDTEQSPPDAKNNRDTVLRMADLKTHPRYFTWQLRPYHYAERLEFLETLVFRSEYTGKIGVLVLDGARDLVAHENDLDGTRALVQLLMKISQQGIHVLTVVHVNRASGMATGHLGAELQRKSETVMHNVRDENDVVTVNCTYSRRRPVPSFSFVFGDDGLPGPPSATTNSDFTAIFDEDEI